MTDAGFGLKAPTVTPEGADDVGSPNRILREQVDGKVIIRTGRRIPGVSPFAGVHFPISVCRMAVGDAYGAKQWRGRERDSDDELAFRTERISRSVCRATAEYAFRTAAKIHGRVYGGPKWTVMAEAPHGTAPALKGKNIANPMGMIMAGAAVLHYVSLRGRPDADRASRAIYESVLEATAAGIRTPDLDGHATTAELTDETISRVRTKIDIWSALGSTT